MFLVYKQFLQPTKSYRQLFQQYNRQTLRRKYCTHNTGVTVSRVLNPFATNWSLYNNSCCCMEKRDMVVGSHIVTASLTEQPKWHWVVEYLASITNLSCSIMVIFMVLRIVLSWYPKKYSHRFPWSWICLVTEPLLAPVRKIAQPVGGVDISPVIWLFVFSLVRELLVGQQGILVLLQSSR